MENYRSRKDVSHIPGLMVSSVGSDDKTKIDVHSHVLVTQLFIFERVVCDSDRINEQAMIHVKNE